MEKFITITIIVPTTASKQDLSSSTRRQGGKKGEIFPLVIRIVLWSILSNFTVFPIWIKILCGLSTEDLINKPDEDVHKWHLFAYSHLSKWNNLMNNLNIAIWYLLNYLMIKGRI